MKRTLPGGGGEVRALQAEEAQCCDNESDIMSAWCFLSVVDEAMEWRGRFGRTLGLQGHNKKIAE